MSEKRLKNLQLLPLEELLNTTDREQENIDEILKEANSLEDHSTTQLPPIQDINCPIKEEKDGQGRIQIIRHTGYNTVVCQYNYVNQECSIRNIGGTANCPYTDI